MFRLFVAIRLVALPSEILLTVLCELFNDAANIKAHTVSNHWVINDWWSGKYPQGTFQYLNWGAISSRRSKLQKHTVRESNQSSSEHKSRPNTEFCQRLGNNYYQSASILRKVGTPCTRTGTSEEMNERQAQSRLRHVTFATHISSVASSAALQQVKNTLFCKITQQKHNYN